MPIFALYPQYVHVRHGRLAYYIPSLVDVNTNFDLPQQRREAI
jgi:hypothetical protein